MTLRVVGAGVGRTATNSLQAALQQLLGGRCYHMHELFPRPDDVAVWHEAVHGRMPDWPAFFAEFVAAVDWPASAFFAEITEAFPDAVVVLSTRRDADAWWRSAAGTIFPATLESEDNPWRRMVFDLLEQRFTLDIENKNAAIEAYHAHNAKVRATVPANRLIEWQAEDGWAPLCAALDLPVPAAPFPRVNTTEDFRNRKSIDDAPATQ